MLSHFHPVRHFETIWTIARQAPLSMGFSRQEYRSGLPCPPPGDLPDSGIEPVSLTSLALQVDSLPNEQLGKPLRGLLAFKFYTWCSPPCNLAWSFSLYLSIFFPFWASYGTTFCNIKLGRIFHLKHWREKTAWFLDTFKVLLGIICSVNPTGNFI